jgi:hypothetical protein
LRIPSGRIRQLSLVLCLVEVQFLYFSELGTGGDACEQICRGPLSVASQRSNSGGGQPDQGEANHSMVRIKKDTTTILSAEMINVRNMPNERPCPGLVSVSR